MTTGAIIVVPIAGLLLLAAVVAGAASMRWRGASRRTAKRLLRAGAAAAPPAHATAEVPLPVARFLERSAPGARIRVARLRQRGEFLMRDPDGWAPFTATQLFTADPPGMLWDARIRMAPFLHVRVRDSYLAGQGAVRAAVAGVVPVAADAGAGELAEASLLRYLAEAAWFPTRLRPSAALRWTPVDAGRAVATLTDAGLTVSLEFRFDAHGDLREVFAERRFRGADQDPVRAPWIGRFSGHGEVEGFRIPTTGVVAWVLDGEERPYWKGRIERVDYETD